MLRLKKNNETRACPNMYGGIGPLAGIQGSFVEDDIYKLYVCKVINFLYFLDCCKFAC